MTPAVTALLAFLTAALFTVGYLWWRLHRALRDRAVYAAARDCADRALAAERVAHTAAKGRFDGARTDLQVQARLIHDLTVKVEALQRWVDALRRINGRLSRFVYGGELGAARLKSWHALDLPPGHGPDGERLDQDAP